MNIAIDARWIFEKISGIGAYTREIIRHLALLDQRNNYVLFFDNPGVCNRTLTQTNVTATANFRPYVLQWSVFSPLNQLFMSRILKKLEIDVFHSANYMIPLAAFPRHRPGRTRCVVSMHDVIPLMFPRYAPRSKKSRIFPLYRLLMLEIGRRADIIVTDSLTSCKDVIEQLAIPANETGKVHSVHCGVSGIFRPSDHGSVHDRNKSLEPKKILYTGRMDPYKNLTGLVEAFAQVKKTCRFPVQLVIAGETDPRYPEATERARELRVHDDVRWAGYVSDEDLVRLYQSAALLALPSRYEGFGLPVVEAMACGTPVVCSNRGALPEIAGDAAILVDPDDTAELARQMSSVLTNDSLAAELSAKGIRRAAQFTWKRNAEQLLDIYEKAAAL